MAPKVAKLNAAFPGLIAELQDRDNGTLPDLRVAILDSDLGTAGAYASGSCGPKTLSDGTISVYGDLGRFQMLSSPTACTATPGAQYLEYKSGAPLNYSGDIGTVFGCLAGNLGTLGCGVEHQLQAFEFGLAAKGVGNELQQTMLRPDAYLSLVFLTDEDDCSAGLNDGMFGDKPELRGESASLRCATRSHACGGLDLSVSGPNYPTTGSYTHPFSDCAARTDSCPNATDGSSTGTDTSVPTDCSPLKDIHRLAGELKSLKVDPDNQIMVAGIFGWPLGARDMASAEYKIAPIRNPDVTDLDHPTVYDYWPVCYDPDHRPSAATTDPVTGFDITAAAWGATGGLRESAFIDEFGVNGMKFSACARDYGEAMTAIASPFARKPSNLCLGDKLVDTDIATAGVQADCRVVLSSSAPNPIDPGRIVPQCPAGTTSATVVTTCWLLDKDTSKCPQLGQMVRLLRSPSDIAAKPQLDAGSKLTAQCLTCPQPVSDPLPGCAYDL